MNMKKMKTQQRQNKRLLLSRETVRILTSPDLVQVDGGILKPTGSCVGYCQTGTCNGSFTCPPLSRSTCRGG